MVVSVAFVSGFHDWAVGPQLAWSLEAPQAM